MDRERYRDGLTDLSTRCSCGDPECRWIAANNQLRDDIEQARAITDREELAESHSRLGQEGHYR